ASCGGSRPAAAPFPSPWPRVGSRATVPVTVVGSSSSPSTGATGAGRWSTARTEGESAMPSRSHAPAPAGPFSLPATTPSYLARAADSLHDAVVATDVPTRYACAHVAALRAAAALLAARARPAASPGARRRPQKNAWVLLAEVVPELTEWATFFAAGAAKRAAAEAGSTRAVTEREA